MKRTTLSLFASVLLISGCATTTPASPPASPTFWTGFLDHPKGYLKDASTLDATSFLPMPPTAGSEREAADIAVYRRTRGLEGLSRWAQAAADTEVETPDAPFKAFECALGVRVKPADAPTLTYLLGAVLPDVEIVQHKIKSTVRPRPYVREPAPLCVSGGGLSRSSSYPSGHSAIGFAWGLILAELAPDRREAILRRGVGYGESRVVCGFHYPSDVDAGRVMGAALVAGLHADPVFTSDLDKARRELDAVRRANPQPPAHCATGPAALEASSY